MCRIFPVLILCFCGKQPIVHTLPQIRDEKISYRLADCIKKSTSQSVSAIAKFYPNSFCAHYLNSSFAVKAPLDDLKATKVSYSVCNFGLRYARRRNIKPLGDNTTLVVHIRLGDVISESLYSVDELWEIGRPHFTAAYFQETSGLDKNAAEHEVGQSWNFYMKSQHFWNAVPARLPKWITRVHLKGSNQHTNTRDYDNAKNLEYFTKVQNVFLQNNLDVTTHLFHPDKLSAHKIDEDFLSAMTSHNFLRTGGGFSLLINVCVQVFKGRIFQTKGDKTYLDLKDHVKGRIPVEDREEDAYDTDDRNEIPLSMNSPLRNEIPLSTNSPLRNEIPLSSNSPLNINIQSGVATSVFIYMCLFRNIRPSGRLILDRWRLSRC